MVELEVLKDYLMKFIDTSDIFEVEKVERYVGQIRQYREIEEQINEEGRTVKTINASQEFTKTHPLLPELNRTNAQIINTEKTINFIESDEGEAPSAKDLI